MKTVALTYISLISSLDCLDAFGGAHLPLANRVERVEGTVASRCRTRRTLPVFMSNDSDPNEVNVFPSSLPTPSTPTKSAPGSTTSPATFEMQELRAQMDGMKKAGLGSSQLTTEKRDELEGYVRGIVQKRCSPTPMEALATDERLLGKWRLGFSTEAATLGVLPKEARVFLNILTLPQPPRPGSTDPLDGFGRLDYILKFTDKVMGLRDINAKSKYTVQTTPPSPGLLTFVYQDITSDVFGMTLPVALFGLLKGRANYVESVYFDGRYWIERGFTPQGEEWFNVYVKEEE